MAKTIQYESQLPGILESLFGKQTTGSSTTTGSANVDPLLQIFNQAMGTAGQGVGKYQDLIASIFREGAQKTPEIIGAYANATGSRASNNSGSMLQLEQLMKELSTAAMGQVLQDKQRARDTAGQAAGNIAQATRSQTTTANEQKGGGNKQLATMGLGFLLNQADKRGWLDALKTGTKGLFDGGGADPTSTSAPFATSPSFQDGPVFSGGGDPFGVTYQDMPSYNFSTPSFDTGIDAGFGGTGGYNFGFSSGLGDYASDFGLGFSSGLDQDFIGGAGQIFGPDLGGVGYDFGGFDFGGGLDLGSDIDFFGGGFDLGFRNGGRVNPMMRPPRGYANGGIVNPARYLVDARGRANAYADPRSMVYIPEFGEQLRTGAPRQDRYADGGLVRNRNYMGERPSPVRSGAVNYRPRAQQEGFDPSSDAPVAPVVTGGNSQGITNDFMRELETRVGRVGGIGGDANPGNASGMLSPAMQQYVAAVARRNAMLNPQDAGPSGENEGMTDGPVGTVAENEAAINGMLGSIASAVTGVPGLAISLGLNALGIPNTPMNPVSQVVSQIAQAINNAIGGGGSSASSGLSPDSVSAATGISGANAGGLAGLGVSLGLDEGFDPSNNSVGGGSDGGDGVGSAAAGGSGPGGDGSSGSGVGASGSASGGDGDSGVGGVGAYKNGGIVRGPGTGISDSIRVAAKDPGGPEIRYSADEFVIPAEVVRMTGAAPWQQLVAAFNMPKA